ncbi:MAG: ADP-forming succinate--CoA ligase subunit beta [Chloroflexi bacterium]|jgi:succinyl-CoA synthetase beta subunit|nr:ADP-forming succinate--CoA ligase subunit beta [Chloroflexota bacterium]
MLIHEYQAKQKLQEYNIAVPKSFLITKDEEIIHVLRKIETPTAVVKAQVHAGGRGKAGGVVVAESLLDGITAVRRLLGSKLVTNQTGAEGKPIDSVLVEEGVQIEQEFYVAFTINRSSQCISLLVSTAGGTDIESKEHAASIHQYDIDPQIGMREFVPLRVCQDLMLARKDWPAWIATLQNLYRCFTENDALLIEINPFIRSKSGEWIALDAKMDFDDNALFRHENLAFLQDDRQQTEPELLAAHYDLSYVSLDGTIGCLVNGAGLAMATMDAIKEAGGEPANFLDVGGSATTISVANGLDILYHDPGVEGVFINVFGGIVRCDIVAEGIIRALQKQTKHLPIVIRLEGNMKEEAIVALREYSPTLDFVDDLDSGATLIVQRINERKMA